MEDIPLNIQMCYACHKGRGYALIYPKVCVQQKILRKLCHNFEIHRNLPTAFYILFD